MNRYSLALLALLFVPNSASALTVISNGDGGAGTLRQAIQDAVAGDTIDFAGGISPITLTSAELVINKNLTISGPGANLLTVRRSTAGGTPDFRIFHIASGAFTVTISGLTISNGNIAANGGGISSEIQIPGTLTVADSTVSGNTAAGGGSAGGGIENGVQSTLILTNSTVSGNTAGLGGGIFDNHRVTLTNSTVSGNTSSNSGGGMFCNGCTLTLTNSTVSGNTQASVSNNGGGGIFTGQGTVTLTNSTLSNNTTVGSGGGINAASGTVTVKNTIIAGNSAVGSAPDLAGDFTSQGHNLIGKSDGSQGFADNVSNDQVGSVATPLDPALGPLQSNGGPTFTHALLTGSPAIDKGAAATDPITASPITADQRGSTRPLDDPSVSNASGGNGSDIGAFEQQTLAPSPTPTLTPTRTPTTTPSPTRTATPSSTTTSTATPTTTRTVTPILTVTGTPTVTPTPAEVAVLSYFLPKSLKLKLAGAGKDSLTAAGSFDDGNLPADLTQPVTIDVGGFSRTVALTAKGPNAFAFKDATFSIAVKTHLKGSSRGSFKLKVGKTTLAGLIDPVGAVALHFHASGLPDALGIVTLTNGAFALGKVRGDLVAPAFFPSKASIAVNDAKPDALSFSGGFGNAGPTPSVLGDVHIALGDTFDQTIVGSTFTRKGDVFSHSEKGAGVTLSVSLDFGRGIMKVKSKGIEVGTFSAVTADFVVDVGAGDLAVRTTVRLGGAATKRVY